MYFLSESQLSQLLAILLYQMSMSQFDDNYDTLMVLLHRRLYVLFLEHPINQHYNITENEIKKCLTFVMFINRLFSIFRNNP